MKQSWNDFNVQRRVKVCAAYLALFLNHQHKLFALAGWSALHYAARWGSIEIVQLLFGRIQSLDLLTNDKKTPLGLACIFNSPEVGEPKLLKDWLFEETREKRTKIQLVQFNLFSNTFPRKRSSYKPC